MLEFIFEINVALVRFEEQHALLLSLRGCNTLLMKFFNDLLEAVESLICGFGLDMLEVVQ